MRITCRELALPDAWQIYTFCLSSGSSRFFIYIRKRFSRFLEPSSIRNFCLLQLSFTSTLHLLSMWMTSSVLHFGVISLIRWCFWFRLQIPHILAQISADDEKPLSQLCARDVDDDDDDDDVTEADDPFLRTDPRPMTLRFSTNRLRGGFRGVAMGCFSWPITRRGPDWWEMAPAMRYSGTISSGRISVTSLWIGMSRKLILLVNIFIVRRKWFSSLLRQ